MTDNCSNGSNCSDGIRLIYSCSGAADVGEIADKVARKLRSEGFAKMTCLAAIGANLSGFVQSAKNADENIIIDGCQVGCARKSFERIAVKPKSFVLTEDFNLKKGETPATDKIVSDISAKIKAI
jgi:uncharacterized metal-binding protein